MFYLVGSGRRDKTRPSFFSFCSETRVSKVVSYRDVNFSNCTNIFSLKAALELTGYLFFQLKYFSQDIFLDITSHPFFLRFCFSLSFSGFSSYLFNDS